MKIIQNKKFLFLAIALIFASQIFLYPLPDRDTDVSVADLIVSVSPGSSLRDLVNSNPDGTTFLIKPGVHRLLYAEEETAISPKPNQKFIGEYGAILSGAKQLNVSEVKREGNYYYFDGQTQETTPKPTTGYRSPIGTGVSGSGYACQEDSPRCNRNEEFYINDVPLKHVDNKGDLSAGEWWFDYGNNRIYFLDNPAGKKVEASVTQFAIVNWGNSGVQIKNLIVEKFSSPAQRSAVELNGTSNIVEFSEFRLNHGTGVSVGPSGIMRNNKIHWNGQKAFGLGRSGKNALVENNEISFNNYAGFTLTWEGGGNKISITEDVTFKGNYSHHNDGPGFWTDIDNIRTTYDGNIGVYNTKHCIQHEISFDAVIKNNFCAYNGGAQIYIQASTNVEAFDNTVILGQDSNYGIWAQNDKRGYSNKFPESTCNGGSQTTVCEPWIPKNAKVHSNKIYSTKTTGGKVAGLNGGDKNNSNYPDPFNFDFVDQTVKFYNNDYFIPNTTARTFMWGTYGNDSKTFDEFRAFHSALDTGTNASTVTDQYTVPSIPVFNKPTGPQTLVGAVCGNGQTQTGEVCDDGNTSNNDQCASDCKNKWTSPQIWNGRSCINPPGNFTNEVGSNYFKLQAENYDPNGFSDKTPTNLGGKYRNDAVDIKEITGGHAVGWMETGEWLEYTINVPVTGKYNLKVRSASVQTDAKLKIEVDGVLFKDVTVQNTGSYDTQAEYSIDGDNIQSGSRKIRVTVLNQFVDLDYLRFEVVPAVCGNGTIEVGEVCDDTNTANNDQCSSDCRNKCTSPQIWNGTSCINPSVDITPEVGSNYFKLQAENYDPTGFFDKTVTNLGGKYRNDAVDIKEITGGYAVGWMETGEWLEYAVNVPSSGKYNLRVRSATSQADAKLKIDIDGVAWREITPQNTGSFDTQAEYLIDGNLIQSGSRKIRVTVLNQFVDLDYMRFELAAGECTTNSQCPSGEQCTSNYCVNTNTEAVCGPMDVDGDGKLTVIDQVAILALLRKTCVDDIVYSGCGGKDANRNGKIDLRDIASFNRRFGLSSCAVNAQ